MKRSHTTTLVAALCAGAVACSSSDPETTPRHTQSTPDAPGEGPPAAPTGSTPPPPVVTGIVPPLYVDTNVDPTRPAFQAKSSSQIAATIKNCVGSGATNITGAMILGGAPSPGGFLTAPFMAGQDMVGIQSSLFNGNLESLRTSVRVDQMTLEYLTALRNTANVVGYNCMVGTVADPSLCACDTFATAYAMLSRCLGSVADPSSAEFLVVATDFQLACQANRGTAIASLVGSSAFAKLP